MKLLLTSAGFENPEVGQEFLKLVGKSAEKIKIIYVPTAAWPEVDQSYVEFYKQELIRLGINKSNIKVLDVNRKIEYSEIEDFDVMFVGGGNTFYLLHQIKKFGFDKIIKKFIENGGVYTGISAGSYIVCPTIEAATWKHADRNVVGLKDLTALNLVTFLITAHYEPNLKDIIKKEINSTKYPVKILTDKQALLVIDNEVKLIGGEEIKL